MATRVTPSTDESPLEIANVGRKPQQGRSKASLERLLSAARETGLPILGLMCVPPLGIEPAPFFALLAKMAADNGLDRLSMGMSDDFETAVMLGASHVRVGSALFGARK